MSLKQIVLVTAYTKDDVFWRSPCNCEFYKIDILIESKLLMCSLMKILIDFCKTKIFCNKSSETRFVIAVYFTFL